MFRPPIDPSCLTMQRKFDWSTFSPWLACRRKFFWGNLISIRQLSPTPALDFGSAIHAGHKVWWETKDIEKAVDAFHESYKWDGRDTIRTPERGDFLMRVYDHQFRDQQETLIANEDIIEAPIDGPVNWTLLGKVDRVVETAVGIPCVLDTKTTTIFTQHWFKKFELSWQMTGYAFLTSSQLGLKVNHCMVDCVKVTNVKKKPGTWLRHLAESNPKLASGYILNMAPRTGGKELEEVCERSLPMRVMDFDSFIEQASDVVRHITFDVWCYKKGDPIDRCFPMSCERCFDWNHCCEFFPICTNPDMAEELVTSNYDRFVWNPKDVNGEGSQ